MRIGLLASCTRKKASAENSAVRLRDVAAGPLSNRFAAWSDRLARAESNVPAGQLYAGPYWQAVWRLRAAIASNSDAPALHVCSCGYGLISSEAEVRPYEATFTVGHPDAVSRGSTDPRAANTQWWHLLQRWSGPPKAGPRSLAELISADSGTIWLLLLGREYLRAVAADLARVPPEALRHRVLIICPNSDGPAAFPTSLAPSVLLADARWEQELGFGRLTLAPKIAQRLLEEADYEPEQLAGARARLEAYASTLPRTRHPDRTRQSDEAIDEYIHNAVTADPTVSFTRLLRQFRDSGRASEYGRFKARYELIRRQHAGTQ